MLQNLRSRVHPYRWLLPLLQAMCQEKHHKEQGNLAAQQPTETPNETLPTMRSSRNPHVSQYPLLQSLQGIGLRRKRESP
jgi:hypothetical protein